MSARPAKRLDRPQDVEGAPPPNNVHAEGIVLSAILSGGRALDQLVGKLQPHHFYAGSNEEIYRAALALYDAGCHVDSDTIMNWLRDRGTLERIGGAKYVTMLVNDMAAKPSLDPFVEVIQKKWRLRRLIAECQRVGAEAYGDVGDTDDFIAEAEARLHEATRFDRGNPTQHVSEVVKQVYRNIEADCSATNGVRISGVMSGYSAVDRKLGGFRDGELYIVAARPGMGKTAAVLNIATNVASPREVDSRMVYGDGVVVFSLEMPKEQLVERVLSSESRVPFERIRSRTNVNGDWRPLNEASEFMSSLPIWIDDTPAITLMNLRARVRQVQAQWDREPNGNVLGRRVRLIIIDYLQLMKGRDGVSNREQEISEISRGLKALAKELKMPIIALSQLNRSVETRKANDKRPQLADLRESGAIEQDADAVIFLYRDEYYFPETTNAKGIAEVIVAKNRNGSTGKALLRFSGEYVRFDNLAPGDYPELDDE